MNRYTTPRPVALSRRTLLRAALFGGAVTAAATSCTTASPEGGAQPGREPMTEPTSLTTDPTTGPVRGPSILLAYFSRPGENYYYGDRINLAVGNTEVLAGMISDRIACDVHRIEAADPYPDDYDATVERNVREQDADARPAIANQLPSLGGYDVVLLASPIWNVRPPMIMRTLAEAVDFEEHHGPPGHNPRDERARHR